LERDSEKVIDYRDKSICDKRKVENNAIDNSNPAPDILAYGGSQSPNPH